MAATVPPRLNNTEAPVSKLTRWAKEPSLQDLQKDLDSAKPAQTTQVGKITRWSELMAVEGSAKPPKVKGRSSVQPKLIRRQAEWRYSALSEPFLSSKKLFKVDPVTFEDDKAAKQNELVLNWQFRTKLNRVKFIDEYVRATVDEGTSIIRVGWKRVTNMVTEEVPVYTYYALTADEDIQSFQQAVELKNTDPRTFEKQSPPEAKAAIEYFEENGQPCYAVQTGTESVQVEKIILNHPTAEIMNPKNVFIDSSCGGDIDKALFVVVSFETNKSDLQKEGKRYKNLDKINWEGNTPITQPDHETKTPQEYNFHDAARKKVVAYEYWGFYDIEGKGKLTPIVATWIGDVMIRMELNPFPDEKLPFVVVQYLPVKRDLYGEPDAELLEDNQRVLGAVTRGMIDLFGRSANGQQGFAKGMLDALNKRRFDNGQDYEFNPSQNPQGNFIEHKYPEVPQSVMMMLTLQNQEAEALTGVKSFGGGISGESYGDVAAGIKGVLDAAGKREMSILRRMAKGISDVGAKFIAMNCEFLSEKETIRVTNTEFAEINREDLKGNFDLETDISTVEVDNSKAQDMGFMLQTIGPNAGSEVTMMILAEIAELKRMPVLAQKLRTWKPTPDPLAEQAKQLELQKLQAELAKIQSEVELNQAKAQQVMAQKDQSDLDFVEQESGTKHARDMEKQAGQARGNMNLEVTKGLLKTRKQANGAESKPDIEAAIGYNEVSDKLGEGTGSVSRVPPTPTELSPARTMTL